MSDRDSEVQPTGGELLFWLEFSCWTALILTPFLYYVDGPAVSKDQLVVRSAVVVVALLGGLASRIYKSCKRR